MSDGPRPTALVVEYDTFVLGTLSRMLEDAGYRVLSAPTCRSALLLVETVPDLALAVTGDVLPDGHGSELVTALADRWPGLHALVVLPGRAPALEVLRGVTDLRMVARPLLVAGVREAIPAAVETPSAPLRDAS